MQKPILFIMRGLPGSGKSYHINKLKQQYPFSAIVASADHFFTDEDGNYKFDPTKLTEAHADCFAAAYTAMDDGESIIVIDNTNLTRAEYTPYVMLGRFYGYEVRLVNVWADVHVCARRNTHGVPEHVIHGMLNRREARAPFDPGEINLTGDVGLCKLVESLQQEMSERCSIPTPKPLV